MTVDFFDEFLLAAYCRVSFCKVDLKLLRVAFSRMVEGGWLVQRFSAPRDAIVAAFKDSISNQRVAQERLTAIISLTLPLVSILWKNYTSVGEKNEK